MDTRLDRPALLDDAGWAAIEQHRSRLVAALATTDAAWTIGSAKELVESVARVVATAAGVVTPSNADFSKVVNDAHVALDRQAGIGISSASDVKAIAQHAKKIVLGLNGLRNDYGTGHGHGQLRAVPAEMVSLAVDAALLWSRWALTRLEHVLLGAPESLIKELRGPVTRRGLQTHLDALALPDQPEDVQRAVGAAFGRRAAGGTFVAREVGVEGPADSDDLERWPAPYRTGVIEGLTLSPDGMLTLTEDWVPTTVNILLPLAPNQIKTFLRDLTDKVRAAGIAPGLTTEDRYNLAVSMRRQLLGLPVPAREAWTALTNVLDPYRD